MSETYQEVVNGRRVLCGRCRFDVQQERFEGGPLDSDTGLTYHCNNCHATYAVCRTCGWYMKDGVTCYQSHKDFQGAPASRQSGEGATPMAANLPDSVDASKLVRDPAGRPGRWYDKDSDTTFNLGPDFRPTKPSMKLVSQPDTSFDEAAMQLRSKTREELVAYALGAYNIRITEARANKDSIIAAIVQSAGYPVPITPAAYEVVPADAGEPDPQANTGRRIAIIVGRFVGRKGMISEVGDEDDNFDVRAQLDGDGQELPLDDGMYRFLTADEIAADEAALKAADGNAKSAVIPPAGPAPMVPPTGQPNASASAPDGGEQEPGANIDGGEQQGA